MQDSSIPAKLAKPFAANAGGSYIRSIPTASQIGIQAGAASLNDGFPPLCFTPISSGGVPPFGQDMNGILYLLSAWTQWSQAGGPVPYDGTFQTAIGGYPKGAMLIAASYTNFWISTVDNNMSNPDTGGANWVSLLSLLGLSVNFTAGAGHFAFGGLILNWGQFSLGASPGASQVVTFDLDFPNAMIGAVTGVVNSATDQIGYSTTGTPKHTLQIEKGVADANARSGTFLAWGW